MQIDPRHLLILAEVMDCGGFTEAAASMGTTQPALSRIVKNLEARLGEPLFVRTRKPLELTEIGRSLVEQGRSIRLATDRAETSVERFRTGREGDLKIGGTPFFTDGFVTELIAAFQSEHPNISVQLSYGYTNELVGGVASGRLDIGLCPISVVDPGTDIEFIPLIEGRNVVACRDGHPLLAKRRITAIDLLNYPWIEPPPLSPLAADLKNAMISIGAERVYIAFSGGTLGSVISYLTNSDALTILPHTVVFAMRNQKTITAVSYEVPHPSRALSIVRSRDRTPSPLQARFEDHIKNSMNQMQDLIRRHESIVVWKR